jgi:hypothetical protein
MCIKQAVSSYWHLDINRNTHFLFVHELNVLEVFYRGKHIKVRKCHHILMNYISPFAPLICTLTSILT